MPPVTTTGRLARVGRVAGVGGLARIDGLAGVGGVVAHGIVEIDRRWFERRADVVIFVQFNRSAARRKEGVHAVNVFTRHRGASKLKVRTPAYVAVRADLAKLTSDLKYFKFMYFSQCMTAKIFTRQL